MKNLNTKDLKIIFFIALCCLLILFNISIPVTIFAMLYAYTIFDGFNLNDDFFTFAVKFFKRLATGALFK